MTVVLLLGEGVEAPPPPVPPGEVVVPFPVMGGFAQEIWAALQPVVSEDESYDWAAARFIAAFGEAFEEVWDLARDGVRPGWASLMDVQTIPIEWLGWLAQFVGARLRDGLSESEQRSRIASTDGWKRGSVGAVVGAAQQYLTGNKTVLLRERANGNAYELVVSTRADETPDPSMVLAALMEQKPAGIILTHQVLGGHDWQNVVDNYATWNAVIGAFLTWTDLVNDDPA